MSNTYENTDNTYENKYKILKGQVIYNSYLQNPRKKLEGPSTPPSSIITLVNNYKATRSRRTNVINNIELTVLEYNTSQGLSFIWDGYTFTRNPYLPNFSYVASSTITIIAASTIVPFYANLINIRIPNSVKSIGINAFNSCSLLISVTIPNSVTSIGIGAFRNCSSLTSITIPNSVTSIGSFAFSRCSSLTSITIPNSVTSIGNNAFDYCSLLTSIIIPNSVTSIGNFMFRRCLSLTSITIPNSVKSIGSVAFAECSSLTSITIPNSVTSIGPNAFQYSGLTTVYISLVTANILGLNISTNIQVGVNFFGKTVTTIVP